MICIGISPADGTIHLAFGDSRYLASCDSSTKKLYIETASKASGWSDRAIRYTSPAVC